MGSRKAHQPGAVAIEEEESTIRRLDDDATEVLAAAATPTAATAPPLARTVERGAMPDLSLALDSIDMPVVIANLKRETCDFANKRWLEYTGQTAHETMLAPLGWAEAIHPEDREHIVLLARTAIEAGVEAREECRLYRRRDRSHVWFDLRVVPMSRADGAATLSFTEIDEARRMKHELQDLDAKMRRGEKMQSLGQLAGGVAHDFNNLLTIIVACTDEALEQVTDQQAASLREPLHEIRVAVKRAASLTRDLLGYSRQEEQDRRMMSLDDVVGEAERMLARIVGEDIELRVDRGGKEVGLVNIDPAQWTSVVMNLAVNARHAMPRGGMLSLRTSARVVTEDDLRRQPPDPKLPPNITAGRYAMLEVRDTGVGFGPDVARKIFEPFFTTKSAGKGTGLGLAVVKNIVDESDGFIGVTSEVGRGTTFRIYLPSETVSSERPPLSSTLPSNDSPDTAVGNETILLVEDDPAVRRAAMRSLAARGFTLLVANDAEEALAILESKNGAIDLVIADVVLPKMNGKRLIDEITGRYPRIRALFTSGYANDDVLRYGLKTSAEGVSFLPKPYTPRRLVRKMREVLDRRDQS